MDTCINTCMFLTKVETYDFSTFNAYLAYINVDCKREDGIYFCNKSINGSKKVLSEIIDSVVTNEVEEVSKS